MNFATAFPSDYNSPHNLLNIFCDFFMVPKVLYLTLTLSYDFKKKILSGVQTLPRKIVIYRMCNFVYHDWGCKFKTSYVKKTTPKR